MDLDAIESNLETVRERVGPERSILGVVKADGYGHGAVPVARRLSAAGIDCLGVAMAEEGMELRRAGIQGPVLILGAFARSQMPMILEAGLTPTVYSTSSLSAVLEAGSKLPRPVPFHLKLDTGMGRLGFTAQDLGPALDRIAALPRPAVEGIYTTLASSEQPESEQTRDQMRIFSGMLQEIHRRGIKPSVIHAANSGAIANAPETWHQMVRPGLILYGLPSADGTAPEGFRPALSLRTRIVHLKTVPEGTTLGYGAAFRAGGESRIATICAGYDDGLNRKLFEGGEVLIRGRRAPFAGRISMDLSTVDVTGIPDAREGDQVTLLGEQDGQRVSAWELARRCGTIPWEILCRIGARVPRVYIGEGAPKGARSRFEASS